MNSGKITILAMSLSLMFTACFPTPEATPTPTLTLTHTSTPTPSFTPTSTVTPTLTSTPTNTPIPTEVIISQPLNQAKVDQTDMVKGNSQNIPVGSVIWIVVFLPATGRYYPQNLPADVQANGVWSSVIHVGQLGESGLKADLIAVLADESAQDSFNAYLADARDKNDFSGLELLPVGVTIYHRISVVRE